MTSENVLNFLKRQNRPFSLNDICQNVPGVPKSEIQKTLDRLVNDRSIYQKTYAKQKIYCVSQTTVSPPRINKELIDLTAEIKEIETKLQKNNDELKQLTMSGTIEEVKARFQKYNEEIAELKTKLEEYSKTAVVLSDDARDNVPKIHGKYLTEYKKRKRICTDIIEAILENYPKTKKHLLEEIGIETDEDVGFRLN